MNVRLDVIVSAVAAEAGLDPDRVAQDKTNIVRFINDTRRELYNIPIRFSALEFTGELVGTMIATAGTVSATQNQAEVTGSSTAFTTAMAGRYISINSQPWQRIAWVSDSTHLTLESSWNGNTISGTTYKIWRRDYALPPKVAKLTRFIDLSDPDKQIAFYDPSEFHQKFGWADALGDVQAITQFGSSELGEAYLGSTVYTAVSATAGSPILDFASGSGLVTGLAAGDRITLGTNSTSTAFYVEKVLTDAKVALREIVASSSSTFSATAMSYNRLLVRFHNAIDNAKVYHYEAVKDFAEMVSNGDLLEAGWYTAVKKGAIAKAMGYAGHPKEEAKQNEYNAEVATLIRNQYKALNPAIRLKPHIQSRYGQSIYTANDRDTRY